MESRDARMPLAQIENLNVRRRESRIRIPYQSPFRHHSDLPFEVLVVTSRQVQEFLDARRQATTNSERFRNARRALIESDKIKVLTHFETRLQLRDVQERGLAIEGLALL